MLRVSYADNSCGVNPSLGALIDHIIFSHAAATSVQEKANKSNISIYSQLNAIVYSLKEKYLYVWYVFLMI